jgi:hypothetical protein
MKMLAGPPVATNDAIAASRPCVPAPPANFAAA